MAKLKKINIKIIHGNIFNSKCQTIVNTVNCTGVMGKGLALEFKNRYPKMYELYKKHCEEKNLTIGKLWLHKEQDRWILNFPTKLHWRYPSKIEYIEKGLQKLVKSYKKRKITSIAFPQLGTQSGKLSWEIVRPLMNKYLLQLAIPVEIYIYASEADDAIYTNFLKLVQKFNTLELQRKTGISKKQSSLLSEIIKKNEVSNFNQLQKVKGMGKQTIKKLYEFVQNPEPAIKHGEKQLYLF